MDGDCPEIEIRDVMQQLGFREFNTRKYREAQCREGFNLKFDRHTTYCAPSKKLLYRFFVNCGAQATFYFLEDNVSAVTARVGS